MTRKWLMRFNKSHGDDSSLNEMDLGDLIAPETDKKFMWLKSDSRAHHVENVELPEGDVNECE